MGIPVRRPPRSPLPPLPAPPAPLPTLPPRPAPYLANNCRNVCFCTQRSAPTPLRGAVFPHRRTGGLSGGCPGGSARRGFAIASSRSRRGAARAGGHRVLCAAGRGGAGRGRGCVRRVRARWGSGRCGRWTTSGPARPSTTTRAGSPSTPTTSPPWSAAAPVRGPLRTRVRVCLAAPLPPWPPRGLREEGGGDGRTEAREGGRA
jgi:hypothetical protein